MTGDTRSNLSSPRKGRDMSDEGDGSFEKKGLERSKREVRSVLRRVYSGEICLKRGDG